MTTLKITPAKLNGSVCVPSSKSMGHREIICAGLSAGTSIVDNIYSTLSDCIGDRFSKSSFRKIRTHSFGY